MKVYVLYLTGKCVRGLLAFTRALIYVNTPPMGKRATADAPLSS